VSTTSFGSICAKVRFDPILANSILTVSYLIEPVIYVNGRTYVVRCASAPFDNLTHTGITVSRVEEMELRLKEDIRKELMIPEHRKFILLLRYLIDIFSQTIRCCCTMRLDVNWWPNLKKFSIVTRTL
jgi:hypothetical protein